MLPLMLPARLLARNTVSHMHIMQRRPYRRYKQGRLCTLWVRMPKEGLYIILSGELSILDVVAMIIIGWHAACLRVIERNLQGEGLLDIA